MDKLAPCVSGLHSLVQPIRCYAVRMKEFSVQNRLPNGTIIWPEVVICKTEEQADRLCDFLNEESFQDAWDNWHEEEPELTVSEARYRWAKEDFAIYVVENVPSLDRYPHLYRISQSLSACTDRFPDLEYV